MSKKAKIRANTTNAAQRAANEARTKLNKQRRLWSHWRKNQSDETALNAFVYALDGEPINKWHDRVFGR